MGIKRSEILKRLRSNIKNHIPIIGTGAGTGISAKFEEAGGTDMIIVYNSGRFRMQGRPSVSGHMPLGDANTIVMELGVEILPVVKNTPVIAGVLGIDPYRSMEKFLSEVKDAGFSGVQNFPTVGSYDGKFRQELESVGYSYQKEVEMIKIAHDLDLLTTPYAYTTDEAERMVKAGADVIVAHCGCTVGGSIGVGDDIAMSLDDAAKLVQDIRDCAAAIRPDVIVIVHGGPVAFPEDAAYILQNTKGIHGFYGASSAERLPVEVAITSCIKEFKEIRF